MNTGICQKTHLMTVGQVLSQSAASDQLHVERQRVIWMRECKMIDGAGPLQQTADVDHARNAANSGWHRSVGECYTPEP